jgi:hypothetical protein
MTCGELTFTSMSRNREKSARRIASQRARDSPLAGRKPGA